MLYDDEFYKMYFENKEDYKTFVLEIDQVEAIERHIVKYKFD